ncbi:FMN-binding protein [Lachnoanaerobaculum sp. OBRC5-5]|uniref:FMN-binding protein n=1 Tax=Lachnoanaerobaculum sp. OBRC5-5 TaxID=936595 RepID=UPI000A05A2C7|nr:FMN-binding protein [Lachnoanaerobaculum sp. OBRC5-5]
MQRGPNVVKVTIKDGKIEKVDSVVYTDDDKQAGSYEIKRDRILKMLEGLNSTKEIAKQLQNSTGEAYDAVSGATETAKGHVSAVENALERSRKFKKEGKKSDIDYIEFVKRPDGVAKGKTLDLTHTVLRLHMSGETKDISFDEFVNYGIVADPANGTELPKEGEFRRVTFRQNAALIELETDIQTEKKITKKYASHILVNYESGETKKIELSNDEYRYKIEAAGKSVGMSIFDGENKLTDGVYDSHISQ